MGMMRASLPAKTRTAGFALAAVFATAVLFAAPAAALDDEAARTARWTGLAEAIFGAKPIQSGEGKIALEVPERALDAALVPVTIRVQNPPDVKSIYLVIDNNPAPLAAHITFGPAADPRSVQLRVRVDQYTYMHVIEETRDGALYESHRFVKASGGCSAPSGSYDEEALAKTGEMKLRLTGEANEGQARQAQLLIRHPNFSGMQKDQITQLYTPARFIKSVEVTLDGKPVLHLESDISISADPSITFGFLADGAGKLAVTARDSDGAVFEHHADFHRQGS
ncbi:MAG: quinoprotein dehydrogenase-associated SoxYZ-like carrier [Beijerinckiaceae bacterium]|nr:quinoprotein dehydrogenase-associated SoxYZ-like carrier [Beijerinckiaceae bacterium]